MIKKIMLYIFLIEHFKEKLLNLTLNFTPYFYMLFFLKDPQLLFLAQIVISYVWVIVLPKF